MYSAHFLGGMFRKLGFFHIVLAKVEWLLRKRNFSWEVHCNILMFRESELPAYLKMIFNFPFDKFFMKKFVLLDISY